MCFALDVNILKPSDCDTIAPAKWAILPSWIKFIHDLQLQPQIFDPVVAKEESRSLFVDRHEGLTHHRRPTLTHVTLQFFVKSLC